MAVRLSLLSLLTLASLVLYTSATEGEMEKELMKIQTAMQELRMERLAMKERLEFAEKELTAIKVHKVAFAVSLGGNGLQKTTSGNKDLIYRDVLTNVGNAYNSETGEFTAPIRGIYYIRFTINGPTDFTISGVLYKNDREVQLIAHEHPSGEGSDTASNGATLLLEKGDRLKMVLWHNTQIWDNSNHHSTFSGFLLFSMPVNETVNNPGEETTDAMTELKKLQTTMAQLKTDNLDMQRRLEATENTLKAYKDVPKLKVAFSASLGGDGLQKTTSGNKNLIYRDVMTNVGNAYNSETGEFTAPFRGVYYVRFTVNGPTDFTISGVLYKNNYEQQLIVHEQPSGEGSDTGSNGATLLLEEGDRLSIKLWHNTQIWDNSNHHSTFSAFLLFPLSRGEETRGDRAER